MNKNTIVITGANGGIGQTLIKGFYNAGFNVAAIDIVAPSHPVEGIEYFLADIASYIEVEKCFKQISLKFGKVHILINNAAISNFCKDIYDITPEEFTKVINVNLCGAFYCVKEFLKYNSGEDFGRIINIASTRFNQNESGWEAYGASKGGIVSLTNSLAVSLSDKPITVNAISPGWIETGDYKSLRAIDHTQHPSGRVGKADDILRVAMFLSKPENDFINAENIIVDGGMTKRMFYAE